MEGSIIADGTEDERINFITDSPSAVDSAWEGIKLRNTTNTLADENGLISGSSFSFITVQGAETGIYSYNQGLFVSNSVFKGNNKAVEIRKTDGVLIQDSIFDSNEYGIFTEYEPYGEQDSYGNLLNTWIKGNTFSNNGTGALIGPNQRAADNFIFDNNIFTQNQSGLSFGQGGYGIRGGQATFSNNTFNENEIALSLDHYDGTDSEFGTSWEAYSNAFTNNTYAISLEGVRSGTAIYENFFDFNDQSIRLTSQNQGIDVFDNIFGIWYCNKSDQRQQLWSN